ncbi:MAG: hypothetical protein AAF126_08945 [Chloroflexota bacterium]
MPFSRDRSSIRLTIQLIFVLIRSTFFEELGNVGYPINTENGTQLDIYNADGSGLIISLPADLISANTACPAENTAILIDTTNDIVFYLLSSCEYYLHAPMNEPGKYYIIIFDDLNSGTYYESRTEFFDF